MATHSSILAWRIPWTEDPDGLQSMGLQRGRHDPAHTQSYNCGLVTGMLVFKALGCGSSTKRSSDHSHPLGLSSLLTLKECKALYSAAAFSMQHNLNSTWIFTLVAAREAVTLEAKRGRKKRRGNSQPRGSLHSFPASQWQGYGECWPAPHFAPSLWLGTVKTPQNAPLLSALLCDSLWLKHSLWCKLMKKLYVGVTNF